MKWIKSDEDKPKAWWVSFKLKPESLIVRVDSQVSGITTKEQIRKAAMQIHKDANANEFKEDVLDKLIVDKVEEIKGE